MQSSQDALPSAKRGGLASVTSPAWLADSAIGTGLLLLRWMLIAAVGVLALTMSGTTGTGGAAREMTLAFAAYSLVVTWLVLRQPLRWFGPLMIAAMDVVALMALTRYCGSLDCPTAFLYPTVIVPLLLFLPTLLGLLAVAGVAAVAVLPLAASPGWTWSVDNLQLAGFDAVLLLAVALPVALLARYLRSREDEMERHRFIAARLHVLNEFMKATAGAGLDLNRAASVVAQLARDAVGGDAGLVYLPRVGDDEREVWQAVHGPHAYTPPAVADALCSIPIARAELVVDARDSPGHALYAATGLRSWVAASLSPDGGHGGMLLVGSRLPNSYQPAAREWLTTIAAQAAQPLANAVLHARERAIADRMARLERTKSEFLLTASHELRTPLATLKISAGLLAAQWEEKLEGPERAVLHSLRRNTDRLERLVDELLDMARLQSGALALRKVSVDVAAALHDAVVALRPDADARGQRLEVAVAAGPLMVLADPRRLDQVLVNLVSNASKYGPAGSAIRISGEARDSGVLVQVEDEGPGIPETERERIFEAFHRINGHESDGPGGMGLGLAIVKGIVELHDGKVGVTQREGGGNTFFVFLPQGDGAVEVDSQCTS